MEEVLVPDFLEDCLHWCFRISPLQGFHDGFNIFLKTLIFVTPRKYVAWLILALTKFWDLLGHFEVFNCLGQLEEDVWAVGIFWTGELLSERKPFQESFVLFCLR